MPNSSISSAGRFFSSVLLFDDNKIDRSLLSCFKFPLEDDLGAEALLVECSPKEVLFDFAELFLVVDPLDFVLIDCFVDSNCFFFFDL